MARSIEKIARKPRARPLLIEKASPGESRNHYPQNPEEQRIFEKLFETRRAHDDVITDLRAKSRRPGKMSTLEFSLNVFPYRALRAWVGLRDLGVDVPEAWLEPYNIPVDTFQTHATPPKYRIRPYNLLRERWRLAAFFPDIDPNAELAVLDFSTASLAYADIFGPSADLTFTDYWDDTNPKPPYAPIWDYYQRRPLLLEGRSPDWPMQPESFDIVTCFQAMQAYGETIADPEAIRRVASYSRDRVAIVFNAPMDPERGERYVELPPPSEFPGWDCTYCVCPETNLQALVMLRL